VGKPCICHDDGVMSVLNVDCPQHGNTDAAEKLKAAFDEIRRHSVLPKFKGPGTAEEDENGVVYLKDADGHVRVMMNREDFFALRKYKLGKK
jgi:hypothetical protein